MQPLHHPPIMGTVFCVVVQRTAFNDEDLMQNLHVKNFEEISNYIT